MTKLFIMTAASLTFFVCSGCVRLQGGAGYWHQEQEDEAPVVKQVGFDTSQIIQRDRQEGSITT